MFRELVPKLAATYRGIAPDYAGFGQSDSPDPATFAYTFDHLASIVDQFTAGAPAIAARLCQDAGRRA